MSSVPVPGPAPADEDWERELTAELGDYELVQEDKEDSNGDWEKDIEQMLEDEQPDLK